MLFFTFAQQIFLKIANKMYEDSITWPDLCGTLSAKRLKYIYFSSYDKQNQTEHLHCVLRFIQKIYSLPIGRLFIQSRLKKSSP